MLVNDHPKIHCQKIAAPIRLCGTTSWSLAVVRTTKSNLKSKLQRVLLLMLQPSSGQKARS